MLKCEKIKTDSDIREDKYARIVFKNHTLRVWWTLYHRTTRECKTFVGNLRMTGFLRESELPAFLNWINKEIPEFQSNRKHKRENEWNVDCVERWGGSYHDAWKIRISDLTPSGEYHRVIYLHCTGSGKLSWSQYRDPFDIIAVLYLLNRGKLRCQSENEGTYFLDHLDLDEELSEDISFDPREVTSAEADAAVEAAL